jgi:hypothetical protein
MTMNLGSEARNIKISYCNLSYLFCLNSASFDSLVLIALWLYDHAVTKAKGEITANTTDATVPKDPYMGKRFLSRWGKFEFPTIQEFIPAVLPFPWPDFSRSFPQSQGRTLPPLFSKEFSSEILTSVPVVVTHPVYPLDHRCKVVAKSRTPQKTIAAYHFVLRNNT